MYAQKTPMLAHQFAGACHWAAEAKIPGAHWDQYALPPGKASGHYQRKLDYEIEKFIRDLKNALIRIENKTYGVCRVTGKLIQKERLKLVPHATLSIEAKRKQ